MNQHSVMDAKNPHRNGNSSEGKDNYLGAGLTMKTTGQGHK